MRRPWSTAWGWIWRLSLVGIAVGSFLIPESWYRSAQHFGGEVLIIFPVANIAIWIGPFAAMVDTITVVYSRVRSKQPEPWRVVLELLWFAVILAPLVNLIIDEMNRR